MRLLVTRPLPAAERTAETLSGLGHVASIAPLLRFEPRPIEPLGHSYAALVLTSANAVRALGRDERERLRRVQSYAVGAATAEAARDAGLDAVAAGGTAQALLETIAQALDRRGAPLLILQGRDLSGDLASDLRRAGFAVDARTVYAMEPDPDALSPYHVPLRDGRLDAVLLYSRRTAEVFAGAVRALAPTITLYCLSTNVAAGLGMCRQRVKVAGRPDERALLDLLTGSS